MSYYETGSSVPMVFREREMIGSTWIRTISLMEKPRYGKFPFRELELDVMNHSEAKIKALRDCWLL